MWEACYLCYINNTTLVSIGHRANSNINPTWRGSLGTIQLVLIVLVMYQLRVCQRDYHLDSSIDEVEFYHLDLGMRRLSLVKQRKPQAHICIRVFT